jgi:GntR family transcriptional regulator/MocR family aminotransferase
MTHRRELFLPPLSLDASCGVPLHQQLRRQLEAAIRRGTPAGAALPSSRALAALLGVSRNTVLAAYDELRADGLLCSRRGIGMAITAGAPIRLPDAQRLLRDAQYPHRTVEALDSDGTAIVLVN